MATATDNKPATGMMKMDPQIAKIRDAMLRVEEHIRDVIPKNFEPKRLFRLMESECRKTPALKTCELRSLLGCFIEASQLGLEIGSALGHAYLIPFNTKNGMICQLIPGYRGLLDLVRRSGQLKSVSAFIVNEKDYFEFEFGMEPKCVHKPSLLPEPGKVTHAYAVAHMANGGVQFAVMSRREIDGIRARSRAGKSGPWVTDFEEMAKKTVLRRLSKLLPMQTEAARLVELDEYDDSSRAIVDIGQQMGLPRLSPDGDILEEVEETNVIEGTAQQVENLDELADQIEGNQETKAPKETLAAAQEQAKQRVQTEGVDPRPSQAQINQFLSLKSLCEKSADAGQLSYALEEVNGYRERGQITADQQKILIDLLTKKEQELSK